MLLYIAIKRLNIVIIIFVFHKKIYFANKKKRHFYIHSLSLRVEQLYDQRQK